MSTGEKAQAKTVYTTLCGYLSRIPNQMEDPVINADADVEFDAFELMIVAEWKTKSTGAVITESYVTHSDFAQAVIDSEVKGLDSLESVKWTVFGHVEEEGIRDLHDFTSHSAAQSVLNGLEELLQPA